MNSSHSSLFHVTKLTFHFKRKVLRVENNYTKLENDKLKLKKPIKLCQGSERRYTTLSFLRQLALVIRQSLISFKAKELGFVSHPFINIHPPICKVIDMQQVKVCNSFYPFFDPNEWGTKNSLIIEGSNPRPLCNEPYH